MIRVVELFAGVGGFRIGLEGYRGKSASSRYKLPFDSPYRVVWSNQWEPMTKSQPASLIYQRHFGEKHHSNVDINSVDPSEIPDHDLLVCGFPCQDYSVATTSKNSKGLIGKKGVLWWNIIKIISEKANKPKYLLFENVDRLLISPSKQRGRDFSIILQSLNQIGYAVEWRVINAADFGMPQKRKRIFILAYLNKTPIYREIKEIGHSWIDRGTLSAAFPLTRTGTLNTFKIESDLECLSNSHNTYSFQNSGLMIDGLVSTVRTVADWNGKPTLLGDILEKNVEHSFHIDSDSMPRWLYLKGPKSEMRKNSKGFEYKYSEGAVTFPDALDKPSRTIITGEGGGSPSRFKHVIKTDGVHRRLTPIELERLNMFPDNYTELSGVSPQKRAFFMGNALVIGIVEKIGIALSEQIRINI
jgi:DNA (cytosine-5)-methyltransferase 1